MSALQGREKAAPKALRLYSLHRAGERAKGAILSRERMAPFRSPKRTQGALPLDPAHWQFVARRTARAAQSKCSVHGFAMNPYYSLPVATAPYYREARVTFSRRQTAYRMRHCCARRIDGTGGKRKLLRTPTRWAERHPQGVCRIRKAAEPPTAAQQRIIEAEANRLAVLTRLCRAQVFSFRRHKSRSKSRLPIKAFLLGFQRGHSLLRKRMAPLPLPPAGGISLRAVRGK